jgi:hypothetical protein
MMETMDKQYTELANATKKLADETNGPEKHVVDALSYQIKAIGDLDTQLEVLNRSINHLNKTTSSLMRRQIWLILVQTIAAVMMGWAAIQITK